MTKDDKNQSSTRNPPAHLDSESKERLSDVGEKKLFRASSLPQFVNPRWVANTIGTSDKDQERIAVNFARYLQHWSGTEVSDGSFFDKFATDIGIVNFLSIAGTAVKKPNKTNIFNLILQRRIFKALQNGPTRHRISQGVNKKDAREFLANSEEWPLLSELLFVDLLKDRSVGHCEQMIKTHPQLESSLGEFWKNYTEKKKELNSVKENSNSEIDQKEAQEDGADEEYLVFDGADLMEDSQQSWAKAVVEITMLVETAGEDNPNQEFVEELQNLTERLIKALEAFDIEIPPTTVSENLTAITISLGDAGLDPRKHLMIADLISRLRDVANNSEQFGQIGDDQVEGILVEVGVMVEALRINDSAMEDCARLAREERYSEITDSVAKAETAKSQANSAYERAVEFLEISSEFKDDTQGSATITREDSIEEPAGKEKISQKEGKFENQQDSDQTKFSISDEVNSRTDERVGSLSPERKKPRTMPPVDDSDIHEGTTEVIEEHAIIVENNAANLNEGVAQILKGNNLSLAYHLACCVEGMFDYKLVAFPSCLIRLLAFGPLLRSYSGKISSRETSELFEKLNLAVHTLGNDRNLNYSRRLLALAALIDPAIFNLESSSRVLLKPESSLMDTPFKESLSLLGDTISSLTGRLITPISIKGIHEEEEWINKVNEVKNDLKVWHEGKSSKSFNYRPADAIWSQWLSPNGVVGSVVQILLEGPPTEGIQKAKKFEHDYSDNSNIKRLVHRTDEKMRSGRVRKMEGRALKKMVSFFHEAVDKIYSLRLVLEAAPTIPEQDLSFLGRFRSNIARGIEEARKGLSIDEQPMIIQGAISCLLAKLDELEHLMDPGTLIPGPLHVGELLNRGLVLVSGIRYDQNWSPLPEDNDSLASRIMEQAVTSPQSLEVAFNARVDEKNHIATARIIQILKQDASQLDNIAQMEAKREDEISNCRVQLEANLLEIRNQLNQAIALDIINDSEYASLNTVTENIFPQMLPQFDEDAEENGSEKIDGGAITVIADFPAAFEHIARVKSELKKESTHKQAEVSQRLKALIDKNDCAMDDADQINRMIERNDLVTAESLLGIVEEGRPLPVIKGNNPHLKEFFPSFVEKVIDSGLGKEISNNEAHQNIKEGRRIGEIDFGILEEDQRLFAGRLFSAWMQINPKSKDPVPTVKGFLQLLGFDVIKITRVSREERSGRFPQLKAICRSIENPKICRMARYGSEAHGHYVITLVPKGTSPREIKENLPSVSHGLASLVFYCGLLNVNQRYSYAKIEEDDLRTGALLDQATILFLCQNMDDILLKVLFDIILPFTVVDPFIDRRGDIPIEMFYGRSREIRELMDPDGSCLIYGGRMLGKSALLHQIRKLNHKPNTGQIVVVVDLYEHRIGYDRPVEDVWVTISKNLIPFGVFKTEKKDPQDVRKAIQMWLNEDKGRRIYLMLDEADQLLFQDINQDIEKSSKNLTVFKNIMDDTGGRFKVIFAGLHNVKRSAKNPNTAIARFGRPICIGPFVNEDYKEAFQLVTIPFGAAGFEFENSDLPLWILGRTSYYPSLVQRLCKSLLNILRYEKKEGPPWEITRMDLESAYTHQNIQENLIEGFWKTLDLDKRYVVIASVIAFQTFEDREGGIFRGGYNREFIRTECLSYWAEGFGDENSFNDFDVLLDEMVGLGVLRFSEIGYLIRSNLILQLMGNRESLLQRIIKLIEEGPPNPYEPGQFRRFLKNIVFKRSPLTSSQEGALFDHDPEANDKKPPNVALIFGSPAAGIGMVEDALRLKAEEVGVRFYSAPKIKTPGDLLRQIEMFAGDRKRQSAIQIIHVPETVP